MRTAGREAMSQNERTKDVPLSQWPEIQLTRRQMMQRLAALGLALPSAAAILEACGGENAPAVTALSDRKSTRLNSSH